MIRNKDAAKESKILIESKNEKQMKYEAKDKPLTQKYNCIR